MAAAAAAAAMSAAAAAAPGVGAVAAFGTAGAMARSRESGEVLAAAQAKVQQLRALLQMSDAEFAAKGPSVRRQKWWVVLSVPKPSGVIANTIKTVEGLRALFKKYSWLDMDGTAFLKYLLRAKAVCMACYLTNSKIGKMPLENSKVERHVAETKAHETNVAAYDRKQQRIDSMAAGGAGAGGPPLKERAALAEKRRTDALVVGSFAAGSAGAAGIQPTSIPVYLRQNVLELLQGSFDGCPGKTTILDKTLVDAAALVKERIKEKVNGLKLSMYIDGGSGDLAIGRKVVAICASSLKWTEPVLLDVVVLECHESSAIQAAQIERIAAEYEIKKEDIWYLCADNAATNKATVDKLNTMGYKIIYARCLPHCINLVVKAFFDKFEAKFHISKFLK